MSTKPRVILCGCGSIAQLAHLPALRRLAGLGLVEFVGVCDADAARAQAVAAEYGLAYHGNSWCEVAQRSKAEAISLCLPPGPNAEVASAALDQGLHVLCEKPPGRTIAQAAMMAESARRRPNLVNMIAFNRRYAPLYLKARERGERLGSPKAFYGRFTRGAMGQDPSNTVGDWITSDGSHALDLAMATIGRPRRVSVQRGCSGTGPDNVWTLHLLGESAGAVLLFGFAAGQRIERFEWIGPGYDVSLELPERGLWCAQGAAPENWVSAETSGGSEFELNYGFVGEYEAWARAIRGEAKQPEADFAYGELFMRVVDGILKAASGETFEVEIAPKLEAPVEPMLAPTLAQTRGARSVVYLNQPAAAQAAYFSVAALTQLGEHATLVGGAESGGLTMGTAEDVEVLIAGWGAPPVERAFLQRCGRLQLVVILGASVKWALPLDLLEGRGVQICNTADAIAASVAEHCLLLTLAGLRCLTDVHSRMRRGDWPPKASNWSMAALAKRVRKLPGVELLKPLLRPVAAEGYNRILQSVPTSAWSDLRGQTVGLLGWGHTARRFAELLRPFECTLLVYSNHADADELRAYGARSASLGEVLAGCKVVSLHRGETTETRGWLGRQELSLLQRGTVVVNTARGSLIQEDALLERAREGKIIFALDVFQEEPLPSRHPLRQLTNVILTPHNASSTAQCRRRVGEQAVRCVLDWLEGKEVRSLTEAQLRTMS